MKEKFKMRKITTAVVIMVFCIVVLVRAGTTASNDVQGKWEYCTFAYIDKLSFLDVMCWPDNAIPESIMTTLKSESKARTGKINDFLNAFGNCGWELVSITETGGGTNCIFKRHK
jgi:hypothetical protein